MEPVIPHMVLADQGVGKLGAEREGNVARHDVVGENVVGAGEEGGRFEEDDVFCGEMRSEEFDDVSLKRGCCFWGACLPVSCVTCVVCQCADDDCVFWFEC